jgi:hypothetical protein
MITCVISAVVSAGLYMAFTSLKRSYAATTDFAINHGDQMRISDYLALDLRRAVAITAGTNDTTITIPSYYDASGKVPLLPAWEPNGVFYTATDMTGKTVRNGSGPPANTTGADGEYYVDENAFALFGPKTAGVWGAATPLGTTVRYYLDGETIYRKEGSSSPTPLASGVSDFTFRVTDSSKVVTTQITFNPTFVSTGASVATTLATSFYNTTLLRNSRRDRVSTVY